MDADERRREQFEALVQASPDFIAIGSIDGKVEFLNPAGRRLIGVGLDVDLSASTIEDYLNPESLRLSREIEQPAVAKDGLWTGEATLRDWRDGSDIPVMATSFLIRDLRPGQPPAVATIRHDLRDVRSATADALAAADALRRSEERQRALVLHMSDLVLLLDADLSLSYASPSASRLLGYKDDTELGLALFDLVHPVEREAVMKVLRAVAREPGASRSTHVRLLSAEGTTTRYEARIDNLLHEPSVCGLIVTARDVTESYRAERSQRDVAEVLELIASESPVSVVLDAIARWVEREKADTLCTVLLAEDGVLRDGASPGMPSVYRDAVDGIPVAVDFSPCAAAITKSAPVVVPDLLADPRWSYFHDLARQCAVRSCWSYPITSPANGATLGSFALYRPTPGVPDADTEALIARASHLVGITVDRHRLLDRLAHQARHDALTALPNRLQLLDRLTEALHRRALHNDANPVVLFFDLDRLKVINDSLGHEVGDELLIRVAERLQTAVGPDDLVARFGGDEFVVLSSDAKGESAVTALAQRVLHVVSEPVELAGRRITLAASVGLVVAVPGQTASAVLRDADIAMYRAKQQGGGGYEVFDLHMRQRAFDRLDLEEQIRHGIDNQQFELFYQPVVDLWRDDRITGFEALVRWRHPERGLLGPDAFLQLVEETGLILPLGEFVLASAVSAAQRWSALVPTADLTMSVNVAAQQLNSPALVSLVADSVRAIAPWSLGLELTESTLMDNTANVLRCINDLSGAGGRLSIDDFGTGYSSLSYLTRLPVRGLKIDRSFVSDLDRPSNAAATVASAIISLAGQLGLTVIAEGIETPAQRQRLLEMGCRYGQGFLFSRPVPEDAALALLTARH
jgi:diguanylate cyclase (GGDEF)-like protein/PAS domain S-box-containing protein